MVGIGKKQLAAPAAPAVARQKAVSTKQQGLAKATLATGQAQPGNTAAAPKTQSEPIDPFQAKNFTPSTQPFTAPTYNNASAPDPRDATYWENIAKLQFTDRQEYNNLQLEQTQSDTAYNNALQTAIKNRARGERGLGEEAIKGNLGASGWLNRTEGEQRSDYTQERANASLTKGQEDQARAAAKDALAQGYGIEAAAELAAAAGRYGAASGKAASEEEPELSSPGSTGSSNAKKPAAKNTNKSGGGGTVKKNGKPVSGGTTAPNPMKQALKNKRGK